MRAEKRSLALTAVLALLFTLCVSAVSGQLENPVGRSAAASVPLLPPARITASSDAANQSEALAGFSVVTVQGRNFIANERVAIYFGRSPIQVAKAATDPKGAFTAKFTVPGNSTAGTHTVSAVQDPYGVSANATITVHRVEVKPRSQIYVPGDTICFSVNSTTPFNASTSISVAVKDSNKVPFSSLSINVSDLAQVGGCWAAPYEKATVSPAVPKGATAGMWTWNATYSLTLYPGVQFNASGAFQVVPEPDLNYVLQRLNEVDAKIAGIVSKQDELYVLIQTNHNYVTARLDQLEGKIASITADGFAKIDTVLGEVKVKVDVLDVKVTSVKDGVATIQTNLGTLTADMAALGANVTKLVIDSENRVIVQMQTLLGPVNATLEELGGKITAMHDNFANVLIPGFGEVEASVVEAKNALEGAAQTVEEAAQTVSAANTLMYAIVALSMAAVIISAMNLFLKRRKAPS